MTTISSTGSAVQSPFEDAASDEAQLATASFLPRYSGRTLDAYRQDLRGFFQWAADAARTSTATPPTSSWPSLPEADPRWRTYDGCRE